MTPSEDADDADVITASFNAPLLSDDASDLYMGVASFCKSFPWHFVLDRRLEMVQLGAGFMRLFGRQLFQLGKNNCIIEC